MPQTLSDQQATDIATAAVEAFLRHPLSLVVNQSVTAYTYEDGVLELGLRPVVTVHSVKDMQGADVAYLLNGSRLLGLPRELWVTTVYDHGWDPNNLPKAITGIRDMLAIRVQANPAGLRQEAVGGYNVGYGDAGTLLSPDEKEVLARLRSGVRGVGTTSVREAVSPLLPDIDMWSGGGYAADEWP
jgi:hypothetical protein